MNSPFPALQNDTYKVGHFRMYPSEMTKLYSNFTPRKSRVADIKAVVVFGIQYFVLEYLMRQWRIYFFEQPLDTVLKRYQRMVDATLGKGTVNTDHIARLHNLGYLPLHIKALPEGTLCPIGVPALTITNTVDGFGWLVNYLETIISCTIWQPMTSATLAFQYKKLLTKHALLTTGNTSGVAFQAHDFSMRGMSSLETAKLSGAGHLLSFTGTDVIPAIEFLEDYYGADIETELVGASVPATEHSVMCMGTKQAEIETFARLLNMFPTGYLSVVSDTWDLWKVLTVYLPQLKEQIMARDGKLVIRPDSGNPVTIICGLPKVEELHDALYSDYTRFVCQGKMYDMDQEQLDDNNQEFGEQWDPEIDNYVTEIPYNEAEAKGVVQLLWETFGGTVNEQGYKVLDTHVGCIYGDSITLERAEQICTRLAENGFASTNWVAGVGSFTYQHNTRDTFGFALKATYGELTFKQYEGSQRVGTLVKPREIFKDPITDDGTKRSKKGLLRVDYDAEGVMRVYDQQTKEQEAAGLLQTVFLNGEIVNPHTLQEIRTRLALNMV